MISTDITLTTQFRKAGYLPTENKPPAKSAAPGNQQRTGRGRAAEAE